MGLMVQPSDAQVVGWQALRSVIIFCQLKVKRQLTLAATWMDAILAPFLADANACTAAPCRQAPNNTAICTDLAAPAPNNATGRVCNCSLSTSFYLSDAAGCVGE